MTLNILLSDIELFREYERWVPETVEELPPVRLNILFDGTELFWECER